MTPASFFSTPFRRPTILSTATVALTLLTWGCGQPDAEPEPEPTPILDQPVAVSALRLEGQTVIDSTSFPADLVAKRRAVLAAELSGTVDRLRVREGQTVKKGQALVSLDTRALEQRLAEAEAVDRQRAAQLDRSRALMKRRSITRAQLLDSVTARDVAAAQLASARLELEKSTLRAPWSGVVSVLHPEVGDFVSTGLPVVELVDASTLEANATVPAADMPYLKLDMSAEITVDALPDRTFTGRISRLGVEVDRRSRTLEAVVELDNRDGLLRPGLGARARVQRRSLENALVVPLASVIELEEGRQVFIVGGDPEAPRAELRSVSLGPVIGERRVVVTEGLEAGDRVIVEGRRRVSQGRLLEVSPMAALPEDS